MDKAEFRSRMLAHCGDIITKLEERALSIAEELEGRELKNNEKPAVVGEASGILAITLTKLMNMSGFEEAYYEATVTGSVWARRHANLQVRHIDEKPKESETKPLPAWAAEAIKLGPQ